MKNLLVFCVLMLLSATVLLSCKKDNDNGGEGYLMVVNASPGFGPIDFYMDAAKINTAALAYPGNTSYKKFSSGQHSTKVTDAGSTTSIFGGNLNTLAEVYQSLYIYNNPATPGVFVVVDNLPAPVAGKAFIRFFNLSPESTVVNFGTLAGASFTPLFTGRAFENNITAIEHSAFTPISAGGYIFDVRINGANVSVYTSTNITIEEGKSYTLFFKGNSGSVNAPLGIEVIQHN